MGSKALLALAASLVVAVLARGEAQPAGRLVAGVDRVLSPTVVATWISHKDEAGAANLDLLVLWRGTPGWFLQGRGGGGSVGGLGRSDVITMRIHYGNVAHELVFDPRARMANVGVHHIQLGDSNVILLDNVDASTGLQVVGTRRVEPAIPDGGRRVEQALRSSAELVDYLRCDARVADPAAQEQMEFICAQVLGRCDARLANPALQAMLDTSCRR